MTRRLPWLLPLLGACTDDVLPAMDTGTGSSSTGASSTGVSSGDGVIPEPDSSSSSSSDSGVVTTSPVTTSPDSDSSTGLGTASSTGPSGVPQAVGDIYYTRQLEGIVVPPEAGVLANDTVADASALLVPDADTVSAGGGAVEVELDGGFLYTPADEFWGPDTFSYTVTSDDGGRATGVVTVFVAPVHAQLVQVDSSVGGFVIYGESAGDQAGYSVSAAGDVNGDGLQDVIVGANTAAVAGSNSGRSYVVFGKTDSDPVNLGALGAGGFAIDGAAAGDQAGAWVGGGGDINGDDLDDVVVGAPFADPGAVNSAGQAYVVFGKANGDTVDLAALGEGGFAIEGETAFDTAGRPVVVAGDIDGDDLDDIVLGARQADPNGGQSGRTYVIFGKADTDTVSLAALGLDGFVIDGAAANDQSGWAVAAAGDVNMDGQADVVIGAPAPGAGGLPAVTPGRAYVVFGKDDNNAVLLDALGNGGFRVDGVATADQTGLAVSGAGDVDGDGMDDVIIGGRYGDPVADDEGRAYVVFGKSDSTAVDAAALGAGGFTINGELANDQTGRAIGAAGDINGDGLSDIIVAATGADPNGSNSGRTYVVFGKADSADVDVATLGAGGIIFDGAAANDFAGRAVSGVGDLNGDGWPDIALGASGADPNGGNSGQVYVLLTVPTPTR